MTEPINHLAGQTGELADLLAGLTDEQLAEQGAYYEHWRAQQPSAFGRWKTSTMHNAVLLVQESRRHENDAPSES